MNVSISVVLYNTSEERYQKLYSCIEHSKIINRFFVVDNSPVACVNNYNKHFVEYFSCPQNLGFGQGHNLAIQRVLNESDYHFVINPDVVFTDDVVGCIVDYMSKHPDIGLLMPKVVYPDGSPQNLCKLLPSPFDLFSRRFLGHISPELVRRIDDRYELGFWNHESIAEVPALSGCFMAIRISALREAGLFDPRFFMYMEDYDLSRRIGSVSKTVFFPGATVVHDFAKESYHTAAATHIHVRSAIKYFNKWGWFFDKDRQERNCATLERLGYQGRAWKTW
jgi:GT2 family glycosyltransferase